jgi:hypothetical protein
MQVLVEFISSNAGMKWSANNEMEELKGLNEIDMKMDTENRDGIQNILRSLEKF